INTEQSRGILRRMALKEVPVFSDGTAGWAAQALLEMDPSQASVLLLSKTPVVLHYATEAVAGKPLNAAQVKLLKECFRVESDALRWNVADILVKGTTGSLAVDA